MGSSQSKMPEPVMAEKLPERLRALQLQEGGNSEPDMDFVYVGEDKRMFLQGCDR